VASEGTSIEVFAHPIQPAPEHHLSVGRRGEGGGKDAPEETKNLTFANDPERRPSWVWCPAHCAAARLAASSEEDFWLITYILPHP